MRKKLCFSICFAVAMTLIVSDFTQGSVVSNSGFENGTWTSESSMPTDWWKWADGGWASWKNNSGQAHSGSKFICVGGNDADKFADFGHDIFDIRTGAIYLFNAWVKTEGWGSPIARLKIEFKNKENQPVRTDTATLFTGQNTTWTKYILETDPAPAGAVRANVICEGAGQGSVWFDDIYFIPAPVTDGADLLVNSGFENGTWTSQADTPSSWWKWSDSWGWASWKNDADYARNGSKFIAMGGNNYSEYAVFGQDVSGITAGERYVFSTYVRAESVWWGYPTAEIYVEFKDTGNNVLRTDRLHLFAGRNPDWNWYNLVTEPAPAGTVSANFVCYAEGEGTMWFDDTKATLYVPEIAKNPEPRSEEENVDKDIVLSWVAGEDTISHNVYFGTDFNDVNNANTSSGQYKGNQAFDNDTYDPAGDLKFGKTYYWRIDQVTSSETHKGDVWSFTVTNLAVVEIEEETNYQQIDGFGGSMTESSAYLLTNYMTTAQRQTAMNALFDDDTGIGLSYLRQPIGSSDFRVDADYTYDDMPVGQTDYNLVNFSIAHDTNCIIPLLQQAETINPDLAIIASPWTAPAWMKDNEDLRNGGSLIDSNAIYECYAEYLVKFVQAYQAQGLLIDALTLQNEPGLNIDYPSMELTADDHIRLTKILGPKLVSNSLDTKIVIWDWNWNNTDWAIEILDNNDANPWIAGTAFHGYAGVYQKQSLVKDAHPDKDIYLTENTGALTGDFENDLMRFTSDFIIGSVRNWSRCVIMWNLALNDAGGPRLGGSNNCRGIITVDESNGTFTKNAEYYALGQVSKFVKPGAVRIESNERAEKVANVVFKNTDDSIVAVVLNENCGTRDFTMEWNGQAFSYELPGRSVTTFTWQNQTKATVEVWITMADKSKLLEKQTDTKFQFLCGNIVAWGSNNDGECNVPDGNDFIAISAGNSNHGIALKHNGSLVGWGDNEYGQCNVPDGNEFAAISAGYWHSIALKTDGSIAAWGRNNYNQCDVPVGNDFSAIATCSVHNLALKTDGSIAAWGWNNQNQCNVPVGNDFTAVACGRYHSIALKSDGSLVAWGSNTYGQCDVPTGNDFVTIASGEWHSLAIKTDGSLVAWGKNTYGQCNVPDGNDFVSIAGGLYHSLAIKSDDSSVAWGYDWAGQCDTSYCGKCFTVSGGGSYSLALRNPLQIDVNDGLMVYFPFDQDGQGTVTDQSGCGYDGTNVGTPTYTSQGKFGGAYDFDPYDYITLNCNPTAGLKKFTASLWFKTAVPTNNYKLASAAWWSYSGGARPGSGWILGTHYPEAWSQNNDGIPTESGAASVAFVANQWNHVLVTYDGVRLKEYRNGQLARNFATTGKALGDANGRNMEIGAWSQYFRNYDGLIDDFRFYNRALCEREVMILHEGSW